MRVKDLKCSACDRPAECMFDGKPLCNKHYQLMRMYGVPVGKARKRKSQYIAHGDTLEIITSGGDVILVDIADREMIEKYSWCVSKTGYAVANIRGKVTKMHRYILGIQEKPDIYVDHRNRNPLDNRRKNLRFCSQTENLRNVGVNRTNKLGILGIRKTPAGKYNVRIVKDRVEHHIGNFDTLEAAMEARKRAEDKYHGEFASHKGDE